MQRITTQHKTTLHYTRKKTDADAVLRERSRLSGSSASEPQANGTIEETRGRIRRVYVQEYV